MPLARWYAHAVVRLRRLIIVAWGVASVALAVSLPTLSESGGSGRFSGLTSPDNPAIQTEIRSFEEFGFPVLTRTAVVQRNPEGLSPAAQLEIVSNAIEFNVDPPPELERIEFALPVINHYGLLPTGEQGTTAITYLYYRPTVNFLGQTNLAEDWAQRYAGDPDDHLVGVTGVIPGRIEQLRIIRETLPIVELVTVALIVMVVAWSFRAVGPPLLTLATAALALNAVLRIGGWLGAKLGFDLPSEMEPVLVALLLGVITDYSVFFLFGMRERLRAGDDRLEAARHSTEEFGPIVLVAGFTVAAGSLALLVARIDAFRAFGPGMALTILISLVVAVTFVPACLSVLGSWLFWPRRPQPTDGTTDGRALRSRVVEFVSRKRGATIVLIAGAGGLLLAAVPVRNLDLGFAVIGSLPASSDANRAAEAAAQGFLPGILSPAVLLVEGPDVTERRGALDRLQTLLEERPGVAAVVGPGDQPTPFDLGAVLSRSGDAARYLIILDDPPLASVAIDNLDAIHDDLDALLAEVGLVDAEGSFAGDTALARATVTQTEADLVRIILVATALGFILLVLFLRALVAPLYLMAVNVLAVSASLGLTTFVFQTLAGQSGLTFYVPFAAAVLLVALGADYSIFGVGYIWAEARDRPLDQAIRIAVPRSSRAINVAGITLALSFAVLGVVPLSPFREFAFTMAVGIIVDVFVVRSFLVPSLVSLVGTASGWPGRSLRPARQSADWGGPRLRPSLQAAAVASVDGIGATRGQPVVHPARGDRYQDFLASLVAIVALAGALTRKRHAPRR